MHDTDPLSWMILKKEYPPQIYKWNPLDQVLCLFQGFQMSLKLRMLLLSWSRENLIRCLSDISTIKYSWDLRDDKKNLSDKQIRHKFRLYMFLYTFSQTVKYSHTPLKVSREAWTHNL